MKWIYIVVVWSMTTYLEPDKNYLVVNDINYSPVDTIYSNEPGLDGIVVTKEALQETADLLNKMHYPKIIVYVDSILVRK